MSRSVLLSDLKNYQEHFEDLRKVIGEPTGKVTNLSGWIVGMLAQRGKARGSKEFEDLPLARQRAIIRHFLLVQEQVKHVDAKRAATLMALHLAAVADGNHELGADISDYMAAYAQPMIRHFNDRQRRH
jgi:hypothetical protein